MSETRVVYLTAGAGGMFCGSCMHDNALARSLSKLGFDLLLVPTYTPIRTDEPDISVDQVFFGGINVYLQQKIPPLRWLPNFLDRFLDNPKLIRRVTSRAIDLSPTEFGKLALSMLQGLAGNQRKEVSRLCRWLKTESKPDIIVFTNILIGGCIPEIKRTLGVPVVVTLQGDDIFLDSLPTMYREKCVDAIKSLVPLVDGFIVHSNFYREAMSQCFEIPMEKIHVTPLGIDVSEFPDQITSKESHAPTIGYLARLSPEKGLHHLIDAFIQVKDNESIPGLKLRVAGWLGKQNESYANQLFDNVRSAGHFDDFEYIGSIERQEKLEFLSSLDVLSSPTDFQEPKGLYVLEALAAGVPVVQPAHGAFPELIEQTGGGLLFEPGNIDDYCDKLVQLLTDDEMRLQLASAGQRNVRYDRNADSMGQSTAAVLKKWL